MVCKKKIVRIEGKASNLKDEKDKRDNNNFYNKKKDEEEDEYEEEYEYEEEDEENGEKYISKVINGLKYSAKYDSNPESAFENVFSADKKIDKKFILRENNRKEWMKDEYYEKFTESEIKKIWQHPRNDKKFKNLPYVLETSIQTATTTTAEYNLSIIEKMLKKDGVYEKRAIEILGTYSNYFSTSKGSFLSFYKKNDDFPNQTLHRFFKHLFKSFFDFGEYLLSDDVIDVMFEEAWENIQQNDEYATSIKDNIYIAGLKLFISNTLHFISEALLKSSRYKFVINSDKELELDINDIYTNGIDNSLFDEIQKKTEDTIGIYKYAHFIVESYTFILIKNVMSVFLENLHIYNKKNGLFIEYKYPYNVEYDDDDEDELVILDELEVLDEYTQIVLGGRVDGVVNYIKISDSEAETYYPRINNKKIYVKAPKYHRQDFTLVDGRCEGIFRIWYKKGGLMGEKLILNNSKTYEKIWHINGVLRSEVAYENNKENGLFKQWNDKGLLILESNYKNGEYDGIQRKWYGNGRLAFEFTFEDGKYEGAYKTWYENGNLEIDCTYKNDEIYGYYKEYDINGTIKIECTYKYGEKHGFYKEYNEYGDITVYTLYEYDVEQTWAKKK